MVIGLINGEVVGAINVARYTTDFTPALRHSDYDLECSTGGVTYQIQSKLKF